MIFLYQNFQFIACIFISLRSEYSSVSLGLCSTCEGGWARVATELQQANREDLNSELSWPCFKPLSSNDIHHYRKRSAGIGLIRCHDCKKSCSDYR